MSAILYLISKVIELIINFLACIFFVYNSRTSSHTSGMILFIDCFEILKRWCRLVKESPVAINQSVTVNTPSTKIGLTPTARLRVAYFHIHKQITPTASISINEEPLSLCFFFLHIIIPVYIGNFHLEMYFEPKLFFGKNGTTEYSAIIRDTRLYEKKCTCILYLTELRNGVLLYVWFHLNIVF